MLNKNVVIYTNESQDSVKLKNILNEWDIDYEERNISENNDYLIELQKKGIFATPATFIDNYCIQGVQPDHLKTELNIN
ncbi:glutaredoxin family protein [Filobacillus milosensis]|uniref:Glutaredoxin family protein n=1 Tax=Filobacillus milosensis TaxID=94137 RepID=A0A4Y8IB92_9BACI|nr:glutaredoxin domain-containing protein [Filobacillus milosensis]TFB13224.1 glutaredoxin family protein [Filobacillus milosensis]